MAGRVARSKATAFFVDENCHPRSIAAMRTRAAPPGIEVILGPPEDLVPERVFGAIFQYPGTHGQLRDFGGERAALHGTKAVGAISDDPWR